MILRKPRHRMMGLLVAVALVIAACTNSGGADTVVTTTNPDGEAIRVIATTSILGDVVGRLGGEGIELTVMIPAGVDPHDFSPSAQQVAEISSADLIVANGLHLEEGLEDVLSQAASEGLDVLEVGDGVDPLPLHEEGAEDDGEHGAFDPHFWQDPLRMKTAVDLIAAALTNAGSSNAAANATEYMAEIDATDGEIVRLLEPIPDDRRLLVTNHDAFEYFAERYSFEIIGTIIPGGSTLAEPSSAEMAALVETIIANQVPAIFVENTASPALAEILAEETGTQIEVVELTSDSLGEPGSGTGTYLEMLITNATAIAEALT